MFKTGALAAIVASFVSCSSGSDGRDESTALGGSEQGGVSCDGSCPALALGADEVSTILRQGTAAAAALGAAGTFAVVDRVGNVLAVYQMPGAATTAAIDGGYGAQGGLEGTPVPATLAAISKAGTGAFLSSQGNAFSSRTASQIIQENFNPGERNQPAGPLFGVQFSQLICSDVTVLNPVLSAGLPAGSKELSTGSTGPRPMPLALSGDPGGFPVYKNGDLVGGIGVELDGRYSIDRDLSDFDTPNTEEIVALAASRGFEAPANRVANNMFVGGKTLRYADVSRADVPQLPDPLPDLLPQGFVSIPLFTDGQVKSGVPFGSAESGVQNTARATVATMTLVNAQGTERFPVKAGASQGGLELSRAEVDALLDSAILTASRTRAAIRQPLDSAALVTIFVVDIAGEVLGMTRSQDAPVFGIDVALQKARTALLFSSPGARAVLNNVRAVNGFGSFEDYVSQLDAFVGMSLTDGAIAMTSRAVGNLARPFYPDGINGNGNGPLSLPFAGSTVSPRGWSPFNDGLQLDLIFQSLVQPLGLPAPASSVPDSCGHPAGGPVVRNGLQIFAGSVPLYRGETLIGAIGVSGDGIDQDDLVAFYGASRRGLDFAGHAAIGDPLLGFNAPPERRADRVQPAAATGTRLRYVNCPEAPFIGTNEQNVCDGL